MKKIKLSIVIPTLGRREELKKLLESIIINVENISYEVLIVDQNQDGLIDTLCGEYKERLNLYQLKVMFKGSSKARNYGINNADGEFICFPDDDAELSDNTLVNAINILEKNKYDVVFGKCVDKKTGKDSVINFCNHSSEIKIHDLDGKFVEATMFARTEVLSNVKYDEKMGAGEIFGSQEGFDLVYRLIKKKKRLYYDPNILFYHPNKIISRNTEAEIRRAFYYSCGFGYLCKKHKFVKRYNNRVRKLRIGMPVVFLFRHSEYKYFKAQLMGIQLGYDYL